ncbi:retrotransposon protein, putative, ty1-copia subclass [Tanacetum coccineum]
MLVSMTPEIQKNLEDRTTFEILQKLKTMFQQQAEQELFETMERLGYPMPLVLESYRRTKPVHLAHQGHKGYRKLNKGALDLYFGNGNTAAVEAIGSYELILPSGMILVLENYHFSPSITRGVISLSRLCDNGFRHKFMDNQQEIKNNLDSTFLWHCRLGHINKKRIEKLQHNGLLKSIDDESFDVCVSCISSKMARKPFTHASERADDLLGIIHSDVCGPFRTTSREESDARILNMVPTKKVNKTPYEMWHGKVPNLSYLKVWGCEALWLEAINAEMQSMKDNEVWNLVDLPPNCKTIGSKWFFKKKTNMDGNIHTYKARLVVKDLENGYMVQPEGFVNPKHPGRVCKLQRSIYGLKQDFRSWNKRFDEEIKKYGFTQNLDEPCVYKRASGSIIVFLILYVDDILLMGNNIPMLQDVKYCLEKCFAMKDLGEAAYILGIKIYRDRSR